MVGGDFSQTPSKPGREGAVVCTTPTGRTIGW